MRDEGGKERGKTGTNNEANNGGRRTGGGIFPSLFPPLLIREWGERRCKKGWEWKKKTGTRGEKIEREGKGKEG